MGSETPTVTHVQKYVMQEILEVHSDTGFRREENEEGEVYGKAIKGVNIIRLGQQLSSVNGLVIFICHLIDWIIGATEVVARSTFTSETHGVVTGADQCDHRSRSSN